MTENADSACGVTFQRVSFRALKSYPTNAIEKETVRYQARQLINDSFSESTCLSLPPLVWRDIEHDVSFLLGRLHATRYSVYESRNKNYRS